MNQREGPYTGPAVEDTFTLEPAMIQNVQTFLEMGRYSLRVAFTPDAEEYGDFLHLLVSDKIPVSWIDKDGKVQFEYIKR